MHCRDVRPIVILGTGGSAFDLLDTLEAINDRERTWKVTGFLDDVRPAGTHFCGYPVLGPLESASEWWDCSFINVIGSDRSYRQREEIIASTCLTREHFTTLVHPQASVSPRAVLGRGVFINYNVSIGGEVVIRDHASLSPGAIVGHNAVVGEYTMLAPGAVVSGFVRVGRGCYIGAGAVIRQHLQVGQQALVGMGSVVTRDVAPGVRVAGNPARELEPASGLAIAA